MHARIARKRQRQRTANHRGKQGLPFHPNVALKVGKKRRRDLKSSSACQRNAVDQRASLGSSYSISNTHVATFLRGGCGFCNALRFVFLCLHR